MQIIRYFWLIALLILPAQLKAAELVFSTLARGSGHQDRLSEERLRKAYQQLGFDIRVVILPGRRALMEANMGRVDGELRRSRIDQDKYPDLLPVPVPINHLELCAFGLTELPGFTGIASLKHYRVGVVRGGRQSERLGAMSASLHLVTSAEQLFLMLQSGRIDLAIGNCKSVHHLASLPDHDLYIYTPPLERVPLYHYLHKRNRKLIEPLAEILKRDLQ